MPPTTVPPSRRTRGFTLVEVMMAATILVVAFMGMIQAITLGSEMLATARRQTLAAQIISFELEKLRLSSWSTLSGLGAGPTSITIDSTQFGPAIGACGLVSGTTLTLSRSAADLTANLREVTFTVTWTKGGTTTAAAAPGGSWLDRLAFFRDSPISRTYTRQGSAYFGKYGLNLTYQRS